MEHALTKKTLVGVAKAIKNDEKIEACIVEPFLSHKFQETSQFGKVMLRTAAALSLFFASVLIIFPEVGEKLIEILPSFFLMSERISKALDYVWGLVGKPVGKRHLMYHLPNIIVYAFGVAGVRQLWKQIHKNNWKDLVESSQERLKKIVNEGAGQFLFTPGFSLLFVGEGDQIARSLVLDDPTVGSTISTKRQPYTDLWGKYASSEGEEGFTRVLNQFNAEDAGEYVLFPVLDEHLFLPGKFEFDIAPHRVEIAVRRMREFEKEKGWKPKRIVIVGDKEQTSKFVTASDKGRIGLQGDDVSLRTIASNYKDITVIDPTDTTLEKIIKIADGRQIFFRSSDQGVEKYSKEFYHRLSLLGYDPSKEDSLTVGYDISDLETEHQVFSQKESEYLPVILSRDIFDELVKNHLKDDAHIFVPRLVKSELQKIVAER
jgi:hypothetical protein